MDKGHVISKRRRCYSRTNAPYLRNHEPLGNPIAMLAIADSVIASSAFLAVPERSVNPSFPTGLIGTLFECYNLSTI
ncbi:MAG: hypothetical protein LBH34_04070 [Prevotellaceae bacterium]|jgi:hypothetical protein|nr:hypothetical protein [Prevotellaceae bacterium]